MHSVYSMITHASAWLRPYQYQIAMALVATILVIYGNAINRRVKLMIKNQWFIIRFPVVVLVCTFGYGALTVLATDLLARLLACMGAVALVLIVFLSFVLLGFLASRERQI